MNATATEARTNAAGFPLVACYRCKGDGTYSYNPHSGTVCFGCGGIGDAVRPHPMKPRKVETIESIRTGLNPGSLLVTFASGSTMGVPAGSSVKVAKLDPATLPNPADYTNGL